MSGYQVQRSTTINAQPAEIYDRIVNFRRWEPWSPWEGLDPEMTKIYSEGEGVVGSSYAWSGNRKAGEGSMTIAEATEPSKIVIDLRFLKPFKSHSTTTFDLEPVADGTRVTWTMAGDYTLMSRVFSIFMPMDRLVGKDFEKGLTRLTADVEA